MKIGSKIVNLQTNAVKRKCPLCKKQLRFKAKCCGQKESYLVCLCGYKEIVNVS